MKPGLTLVAAAVTVILVGAWCWSFVTKSGVLISTYGEYFDYDAYGFEPNPATTYEPIGRTCLYLRYDGSRIVILIETDALESARRSERNIDPRLASAVPIDTWYDAKCPGIHRETA